MKVFRVIRRALAVAALVGLASCGGGDQKEKFVPERVVSFGDESNVIEQGTTNTNGTKYTINYLLPGTSTLDCPNYAIWVQVLASDFGQVFPDCLGAATASASRIYASAAPGENRAVDVATQIANFLASADAPFRSSDLVTFYAGTNDIVEASLVGGATQAQMTVAVEAAARSLAAQINRVADAGAKVLFMTVPNVGYTPWGRNVSREALLTDLTQRFNSVLRASVYNDGKRIALVDGYEKVRQMVIYPSLDNLTDVSNPQCVPADLTVPNPPSTACTSNTLLPGSNVSTWLWADNLRLGPVAHRRLGELATERTRNHPFSR